MKLLLVLLLTTIIGSCESHHNEPIMVEPLNITEGQPAGDKPQVDYPEPRGSVR